MPAEPVLVPGRRPRFVGRGGEKLDAALDRFAIDVRGVWPSTPAPRPAASPTASSSGAPAAWWPSTSAGASSTSGFVRDDRVLSLERTNIRTAALDALGGEPFDLVVADLSFISLRTVAVPLVGWTRPGGDWSCW